MDKAILEARRLLAASRKVVALTGAGISVESGIPDFRSPNGLWARYPPDEYATIEAYRSNPDKVWKLWHELAEDLRQAQPNPAHHALAELEAKGALKALITQNIDGLHQCAGSREVIEYHGNASRLVCLECGRKRPIEPDLASSFAPRCDCAPGALMKPDVVFFGELIPARAMAEAERWASRCDVMIVVGTSANVYPCAGLPFTAKEHHAVIIEVNLETTDYSRRITDCFIQGKAGETMPLLLVY